MAVTAVLFNAGALTAEDAEAQEDGEGDELDVDRLQGEKDGAMSGRGAGWSPFLSSSSGDREASERALASEIEALERTLREHGVLSRRELGRRVGCRYRDPGRYGVALRAAVRDGRIRRVPRGVYAPVEERDRASS